MKALATLALIHIVSCAAPSKPAPTNPPPDSTTVVVVPPEPTEPPDNERDAEAKKSTCVSACANVSNTLHCPGWAPAGETCEVGCGQIVEALGSTVSLSCITAAKTCTAAANCLK